MATDFSSDFSSDFTSGALSGPPYPAAPQFGSNGLGVFVAGLDPIGDIPQLNFWTTVVSQYANSPIITGVISSWFSAIDQTAIFNAFYDNIWNIDTAFGYGLDVWGRIVGLPAGRTVQVNNAVFFGFKESGTAVGFGQGQFYAGYPITSNYQLSDTQFRRLIQAKALANISNGSIHSINKILLTLFPGRGQCYVQEGTPAPAAYFGFKESGTAVGFGQGPFYTTGSSINMTMSYTFTFALSPVDYAIINSGVLPKPAGVSASVQII